MHKKFALLVGIPTLALLASSTFEVSRLNAEKFTVGRFDALARLSVDSSQALHEFQKERGASAGFLGSKGSKFGQILKNQRTLTNLAAETLETSLDEFDVSLFDAEIEEKVTSLEAKLAQLASVRGSVDSLSISVTDQVAFYSELNLLLLSISDSLGHYSPTGAIANTGTAFATFLQSKERAGIERAVVSNVFSQKSFGTGGYERFTDLVNTQNIYLTVFSSIANSAMLKEFEVATSDASFDQVERMRLQAKESHVSGDFNIDPEF